MELTLKRIAKKADYTIGKLYINGEYFCDTLEDTDRGLRQDMQLEYIKRHKVFGKTAIPTGTYEISMNIVSPKFRYKKQYQFCGGKLPRLLNVKGFDGICIHIGNYVQDTDGCPLVGKNTVKGAVMDSTKTFIDFHSKLQMAADLEEKIMITVE
jgi:hypothetical protein